MNIHEIGNLLKERFGIKADIHINIENQQIKNLLTDSRNSFDPEGTLFFAINTPGGNDGHKFINNLYDKGVKNFIVNYIPENFHDLDNVNFLIVPDSIEALTIIGKQHAGRAKEILGITGSRGKTTLKEMIFELMNNYSNISRSPRSFNSKIGVPLSLWQIIPDTDLAIIEAGVSKRGEMENLAKSIKPDTVIITNIGEAHSQGFSSLQEKANEKSILAKEESVKTVIYPFDSPFLREALKNIPEDKRIIGWSLKDSKSDLFIRPLSSGPNNKTLFEYRWQNKKGEVEIKVEKDFDIENFAGALAFMLKEGLSENYIEERFKNLHKISTRLNVSEGINGCSVILDCYTSDLSSLLPAIDFMKRRKMPFQTLTLIISDLQHEGKNNYDTYKEIANLIQTTGINKFIGVGKSIKSFSYLFSKDSYFYDSTDALLKEISASDFNDEIILIKGSPEFEFKTIHDQLEAKKHETVLEINLDAILRNYNYFRSHVPSSTGIIAMVKASGYGAGSYEIAKTLQDAGAAYLAVAVLDEGIELRRNGIIMPIIVMNPRSANYKALFKHKLEPVIYSLSMLQEFIVETKKYKVGEYPVHIKLDTGMHRMGFESQELDDLIKFLGTTKEIKVASIFSHLATADCLDMDEFTGRQLEKFEDMSTKIINNLDYTVKRHILNSAGILRFPKFHYDFVRLGIGLYGANTLPYNIEKPLATVSTLRSVIICIREIEQKEAVGYGRKGKITRKSRIATIPIGYADGINRKFGNGAMKVLINGKEAPTIGNICMDATMIDVSGIDCKEGDSIEIFGENISIQRLADTLDTIPYEILTSVSPRVKRIYYRE